MLTPCSTSAIRRSRHTTCPLHCTNRRGTCLAQPCRCTHCDFAAPLPEIAPAMPHLVDTTMFWSERGGGVRRYLLAKRAGFAAGPSWRHTIVAPGAHGDGMVDSGG